jgi:hypothetical protein
MQGLQVGERAFQGVLGFGDGEICTLCGNPLAHSFTKDLALGHGKTWGAENSQTFYSTCVNNCLKRRGLVAFVI